MSATLIYKSKSKYNSELELHTVKTPNRETLRKAAKLSWESLYYILCVLEDDMHVLENSE